MQTAVLPPSLFYCLLDELPLHLIPRRALESQSWEENVCGPLLFNSECYITSAGQVPTELESQRHLLEGFSLEHTIAWVRDPATTSLHPFWLGPRLQPIISGLSKEEPAPASLSANLRFLLSSAGILTPSLYAERRRAQWSEIVRKWAPVFREKGFAPLRELIHPFTVAALRRYYRHTIRRGSIQLGDPQCPRRYVAHNERVARFFHHQLANVVSAITGEAIKPSYVYLVSYLSGAKVKKHTDREQCEFSISLCLDFSPEPELGTPWPLCLDTPAGTVAVYQALGDGLLYRGRKLPHHRDVLAEGRTSTSIIFHYVRADFSGPLE
jgi:hypothetical protein